MIIPENPLIYVIIVTLIIPLPGNIFIIVVNIQDYFKNRRLLLSDHLMIGLSVFNLLHELLDTVVFTSKFFEENTTYGYMYLNMCSVTFSSLLSIHFCLKIVNIHHWFYIGLQRRFSKLLPWPLMTVISGYFFLSLYSVLEIKPGCLLNTTSSDFSLNLSPRCSWSLLILMICSGLCTVLCTVSALTILISLLKHMKRIQENTEGSRSPNMDAHIRAVKTITVLLVANIVIFISLLWNNLLFTWNETTWTYLFNVLIPICHIFSCYSLIKGTKKLDMALAKILQHCPFLTRRN
ncbi:hypothetical protein GDO81_021335 [Engystomops pustulosus]|uniref:Taste receptor type 2 n=1 Tax=Engystomops pustulosus TaxID=76066 RepID=A0AAV6YPH2_ENGPU|nr:hypothetical protein GDO81_021335 [Engystomops pustulosus]